jgi:cadmium resistance protein CadD (predicted permease)
MENLMSLGLVGQAIALFSLTNVDDIIVLAVFFGQAISRSGRLRVVLGQYLGVAGILLAAVVGTLGAGLLPEKAIPYLGLLPLFLGLRAAWRVWQERRQTAAGAEAGSQSHDAEAQGTTHPGREPGVLTVAAVTLANGGDNIGVYVPVFAATGVGALLSYVIVFLLLVAVWCVAGWWFASRPVVAQVLTRWGHLILPVVLIAIGLIILIEGGAFGLYPEARRVPSQS